MCRTADVPFQSFRFYFIECLTTTFLHTHFWLNWVHEDDDEDEVGLKEKPEDTRYINKPEYIEIRSEAPGVWAKDLAASQCIAIIGIADSEKCRCVKPDGA